MSTSALRYGSNVSFRKSARVDNATLHARTEEVHQLVSTAQQHQKEIVELLQKQRSSNELQEERLEAINTQLVAQNKDHYRNHWELLGSIKTGFATVVEVKQLLVQVAQNVATIQAVLLNPTISRSLDPTKELPAILQDTLGRVVTIPPEWIDKMTWNASNFVCLHSTGYVELTLFRR